MCGIIGYSGKNTATDILFDGLSALEYRGYDSAGISLFTEGADPKIITTKARGRLSNLIALVTKEERPAAHCGIGHTRWATHGEPSDRNAHPHATPKLSLVHNGIIENYLQIREFLQQNGAVFHSETDTECAALLLDHLYDGDPIKALSEVQERLEGTFAFAVLFADHPGHVYAARRGSPLIVAQGDGENFIASDIPAVLRHTNQYYLLDDGDIADLTPDAIQIFQQDTTPITKPLQTAEWTLEQAQKGGYAHYMLKEIHEQPKALLDTIHPRIAEGIPSFSADGIPDSFWNRFDQINIVACGTALHAGLLGKELIESFARVPVNAEIASEFRYKNPILSDKHLVVLISQSGETADTLAALRLAKQAGASTLSIVNVAGSSIERESDYTIRTYAGPEIAVASTKAYSAQLSIMYLLAAKIAMTRGRMSNAEAARFVDGLLSAVEKTKEVLSLDADIKEYVSIYKYLKDLFFLGRGMDYSLAQEGSLKLKEISYIHCEAYAAGELKHGTLSLITDQVPVIALATQEHLLLKMVSNIKEVRSRGAEVLLFCKEGFAVAEDVYTHKIELPALDDIFMPLVGVIPLQLLAYHTAVQRNCDVDKPRNLAKSVTVE